MAAPPRRTDTHPSMRNHGAECVKGHWRDQLKLSLDPFDVHPFPGGGCATCERGGLKRPVGCAVEHESCSTPGAERVCREVFAQYVGDRHRAFARSALGVDQAFAHVP